MKLIAFACLAILAIFPSALEAAWFGHGKPNATIDEQALEHGATTTLPARREHVETGPDRITIHSEHPIPTKIVEIPVVHTAVVTATVTATETAVAVETRTVTDTKTVHAVETVLPTVNNYRLAPGEKPKAVAETDELVYRRCFDITVPRTTATIDGGVRVHSQGEHLIGTRDARGVVVKNSASSRQGGVMALALTLLTGAIFFH